MAVMASEAIEALPELRFEMLLSSFISKRILSHPAVSIGGSPPKTTANPSFQLYTMPRILQAATLKIAMSMRLTFTPISSKTL